jgi:hypothetical protein
MDYRQEEEKELEKGRRLVYDNQKEAACECLGHFDTGKLLVMLVAQPGTGKTGTVLEVLKLLTIHPDDERCVDAKNIHIISGMDDTEWTKQFRAKMLPSFRDNIHHRSTLNRHKDDLASITNGILITDECHVASEKNMTVSKVLRAAALNNCNVVRSRHVRLFDISATPESVGWDIESWGDKAAVVRLLPGPSYKGFQVMLNEERIKQAPSFTNYDTVKEWFQFFQDRYKDSSKKFFPIRVQKLEWMGNIRRAIAEFGWFEIRHDSESRVHDIDRVMSSSPSNHTIIFIKGFWRASKRLVRTHVGGSYEYVPNTRNVTTASQGLIGRFCDNFEYEGDEINPQLRPVHFGDKESIEAYVQWFNEGCDFRKVDYSSTRIKSFNGHVKAKSSKIHASNMINLDAVAVQNNNPDIHKRVPVVVGLPSAAFVERIKSMDTTKKIEFIRKCMVKTFANHESRSEFLSIIQNSTCFQISTPGIETTRSYKIHIEDVVNAFDEDRKYGLMDVKEEFKKKSCWQVYIDEKENRLCILWQVFFIVEDDDA